MVSSSRFIDRIRWIDVSAGCLLGGEKTLRQAWIVLEFALVVCPRRQQSLHIPV
jgi:hypothetical protein